MKIIRIEFFSDFEKKDFFAAVEGRFKTVPGVGRLQWENKDAVEKMVRLPFALPLPVEHYPHLFSECMISFAKHHGLATEMKENGELEIYEE